MDERRSAPSGAEAFGRESQFKRHLGIALLLLASFAAAVAPVLFIVWLMQSVVPANPGTTAHNAPHGTRLQPLPRTASTSIEQPSGASHVGLPQGEPQAGLPEHITRVDAPDNRSDPRSLKKVAKHKTRAIDRTRVRVAHAPSRKSNQALYAYAQDWNAYRRRLR